MAKRFITPDWKLLRNLPEHLQRAWFYVWDKSDEAGVYEYDAEYLKLDLRLDEPISLEELGRLPECQILRGGRLLIKNFLSVNYGSLKPDYNPHKPAFRAISKNGLVLNPSLNEACPKLEEEDVYKEEDVDVLSFGSQETFSLTEDVELPEKELETAEMNQFTQTKNKNTDFIKSQWRIFVRERINDPPEVRKPYKSLSELTGHFLNWIRPKHPKNGTYQQSPANKPGTSAARVEALKNW